MSDHIEEIACLNALLTLIAARIEALKLQYQTEALKKQIHEMNHELESLKEAKE